MIKMQMIKMPDFKIPLKVIIQASGKGNITLLQVIIAGGKEVRK